ncbi:ectoine/hydroxyectoine ABC transporter substrate-binding protein EhuB [Chelativorans sp. AA-79]|uniref:ectoine/hydroxyectoine ABC transporter substrate-binding protein EhuB n=1 Tax=Chelativorans sp. AA-79 TaxID=3028735 RepID=UPI0023F92B80|nr:ectoine/hydroxyectoine ABC transporter substrate-binding protein EhuB [Chelativorans sp. AA-79]WEX10514.1 ectoine/hydroxyectoine ABC transporter substrate-binding protein EhuB [Chelativorans sp. AA-79]
MTSKLKMTIKAAVAATALAAVATTSAGAVTLQEIQDRGYIRIAVANEIPYGYVDPSGVAKGAGPDVAKAVVERLGINPDDIQWVVTNFSSLIPGLQANRFDMTAAEMAIRPERCQNVIYSEPNSSYGEGLLVPEGNPKDVTAYSDFTNPDLKVAVMAGADQLQMLQALEVPEDNIVTIASNSDAISTVSTGRADAYAATGLTVSELADKNNQVQIVSEFEDPVIDGKEVRSWGGFNFNSESTDLRDAFNEELLAFKKTEEWKSILEGYGFTPADISHSSDRTTEELCSAE